MSGRTQVVFLLSFWLFFRLLRLLISGIINIFAFRCLTDKLLSIELRLTFDVAHSLLTTSFLNTAHGLRSQGATRPWLVFSCAFLTSNRHSESGWPRVLNTASQLSHHVNTCIVAV